MSEPAPLSSPVVYVRPRVFQTAMEFWWGPPADTGGYDISGYALYDSLSNYMGKQYYPNTVKRAQIQGLTADTQYQFALEVTNTNGDTTVSNFRSVYTDTRPLGPTAATATTMDTSGNASVTWTPASNTTINGFAVVLVEQSAGTTTSFSATPSQTSQDFSGLSTELDYTCYVYAGNDAGWSLPPANPLSVLSTASIPWIAAGFNGDNSICISKSLDTVTFTQSTNNPFSGGMGRKIAWNGSYWVAVGISATDPLVCIAKSTDGMSWTPSTDNPFIASGSGIAWNGSYWIALGESGNINNIAKSTDAMTWTPSTDNPFSGGLASGIAWNGSYWVAIGITFSEPIICMAKSTDGMTWTPSTDTPFTGIGNGIAWNGSYWIAVGIDLTATISIAKSTDGMTWTPSTNNPFSGGAGQAIAWNGSYWVATGINTTGTVSIAKSTDGMTWTPSTYNRFSGSGGLGIAWNGSLWIAIGTNNMGVSVIVRSHDGMTWTPLSNNPFNTGESNVIFGIAAQVVLPYSV